MFVQGRTAHLVWVRLSCRQYPKHQDEQGSQHDLAKLAAVLTQNLDVILLCWGNMGHGIPIYPGIWGITGFIGYTHQEAFFQLVLQFYSSLTVHRLRYKLYFASRTCIRSTAFHLADTFVLCAKYPVLTRSSPVSPTLSFR